MGKISYLKIVVLFLIFSGCSKNSDEPAPIPLKPINKSANLLGTGDSANDILSNTNFDTLLVEIAHVEKFRPTQEAMDNFMAFLRQHTFKQNIELIYKQLPASTEETLTLQEIADLETKNRSSYNNGKTLAIYIYFADAPSEDDDEEEGLVTLGAVYRNTSMVIHEATVRRLAGRSLTITTADVETATLNHEFGHLFGLVDLGSPAVNLHEDPEAKNHCNVTGCLMRAELLFTASQSKQEALAARQISDTELKAGCILRGESVLSLLEGNMAKGFAETPGLDAECILDLQTNGGR